MSSSHPSMDLNLGPLGQVMENMVILSSPFEPFSAKDSVMITPTTTIQFANNMLTSSDQRLLA